MVNEQLFAFFLLLFSVDLHVKIQMQIEIWAFTLIFTIQDTAGAGVQGAEPPECIIFIFNLAFI